MNAYFSFFDNTNPQGISTKFSCREILLHRIVDHMFHNPDTNTNYYFGHIFCNNITTNVIDRYLNLTKLIWKDPTIECSLVTLKDIDNRTALYWNNNTERTADQSPYGEQILVRVNKPVNPFDVSWLLYTSWFGFESAYEATELMRYIRIKRFSDLIPDIYDPAFIGLTSTNGPLNLMYELWESASNSEQVKLGNAMKKVLHDNYHKLTIPKELREAIK